MTKPRLARDYAGGVTEASRSVLAEVATTFAAYRDALVLVGGWAPYLILEKFGQPGAFQANAFQANAFQVQFVHVGSIDIDLLVDPRVVDAERYATIVELLLDRGYNPGADPLCQFEKSIRSAREGQDCVIRVDMLTPEPFRGQGRTHRHRQVQRDLRPRTLPGSEVALAHWFWYELRTRLPDGAQAQVRLKVADVVSSLALKGMAIGERYAGKDAYEIYALCAHYRGGPPAMAEALRPFLAEAAVRRGLASIAQEFRALDAEGPTWVAAFLGATESQANARTKQDAFMTVREVLKLSGIL